MTSWSAGVMMLVCVGCERAGHEETDSSPTALVEVELSGIETLPRVRLSVPRFGAEWSALPAAYMLRGGSAREGFMTTIFVREGECFSPRCDNEQTVIEATRRTQTCTTARRRSVHVEQRGGPSPLCCIASWTAYADVSDAQRRIATGIESACASLSWSRR